MVKGNTQYIMSLKPERLVVPVRLLRGNVKKKLKTPRIKKAIYAKCQLHRGVQLWNELDEVTQHLLSRKDFSKAIWPTHDGRSQYLNDKRHYRKLISIDMTYVVKNSTTSISRYCHPFGCNEKRPSLCDSMVK